LALFCVIFAALRLCVKAFFWYQKIKNARKAAKAQRLRKEKQNLCGSAATQAPMV